MELTRVVLPFDREEISIDEIKEHLLWYGNKVEEAYKVSDKKDALSILKEINGVLKQEDHYCNLIKVSRVTQKNALYHEYSRGISNAFAHQSKTNSYSTLKSNLYDIGDYLNLDHFKRFYD